MLVVIVAVLLGVGLALMHLGRAVDGMSRTRPAAPQGFFQRKLSSFQQVLMKTLPETAIKTVVVVWQIIFQV